MRVFLVGVVVVAVVAAYVAADLVLPPDPYRPEGPWGDRR